MKIIKQCLNCNKDFTTTTTVTNKGFGKFCSISCSSTFKGTRPKIANTMCAYCGIPFYKKLASKNSSKHQIYFCCRSHKDMAQRIGGIKQIQPSHYGDATPKRSYRELAIRELPHICVYCGYDRYLAVLDVHHKDGDRTNNHISNLEFACPTCHVEQHYLNNSGRFA